MRQCWSVSFCFFSMARYFLLLFLGTSYGPTVRVLDALLTTLDLSHEFLPSHSFTSFIYISGHIWTTLNPHSRSTPAYLSPDLCCVAQAGWSIALRWLLRGSWLMTTKYGEASTRLASKNPHFFFSTDYNKQLSIPFLSRPRFIFLYFFSDWTFRFDGCGVFSFWVVQ
jgi:hypothetical protein